MTHNKTQNSTKPGTKTKNRTNDLCLAYLQQKWRAILTKRFAYFFNRSPDSAERMSLIIECMIKGMEAIFINFSDLKDTQFNKQIVFPGVAVYSQRMAEMLFYYRLLGMGFSDIESKDAGPDFIAKKNGEIFCFEVVTPTPQESVREIIDRNDLAAHERDLLFSERLLSVTSAIKEKLQKFEAHKSSGRVPNGGHYIIVINDSLLLPYDQPWYGAMAELCYGDSTLPIAVDAMLGAGNIDFGGIAEEAASEVNGEEYQNIVMECNYEISINGGPATSPAPSMFRVNIREEIPTRKRTDTIAVNIAESIGVAGIYQITLREDLMFFHSFPTSKAIMPASALISSVKNKNAVRNSIFFTSSYARDENLVQPLYSPARMIGLKPHEFNNELIYKNFFKPYLEGGEFYKPKKIPNND